MTEERIFVRKEDAFCSKLNSSAGEECGAMAVSVVWWNIYLTPERSHLVRSILLMDNVMQKKAMNYL